MFIAALFIIARTWKQPRCPSADEWIRKLWYIYMMEYYLAIKKNIFESVLMRWMKLEWSKSERKTRIQFINVYMEFRKVVMMTLYARQQKRHSCKEQTFGLCGRRQGWDDLREQDWIMYIIIYEIDLQFRFDAWDRVLRAGALGWPWGIGWVGRWKGVQDGEHMYTIGWFMSMYGKDHYNIIK